MQNRRRVSLFASHIRGQLVHKVGREFQLVGQLGYGSLTKIKSCGDGYPGLAKDPVTGRVIRAGVVFGLTGDIADAGRLTFDTGRFQKFLDSRIVDHKSSSAQNSLKSSKSQLDTFEK